MVERVIENVDEKREWLEDESFHTGEKPYKCKHIGQHINDWNQ